MSHRVLYFEALLIHNVYCCIRALGSFTVFLREEHIFDISIENPFLNTHLHIVTANRFISAILDSNS